MSNENLSDEVWRRKDDLSARQTAANVVGYIFEGKEIDSDAFLDYAEKIRAWLFTNQLAAEIKPLVNVTTIIEEDKSVDTPQPTQQQDKILKAVAKKTNLKVEFIRAKVYEYYKKYPTNEASVEKVIKEINFYALAKKRIKEKE